MYRNINYTRMSTNIFDKNILDSAKVFGIESPPNPAEPEDYPLQGKKKMIIMRGMNQSWINQSDDGVIITVHAVPRAAKDAVQGLHGDALKIRLHAPPVDGKANEALVSFLGKMLNIPKGNIALKSGANQRRKIVLIAGISAQETSRRLGIPILP